MKKKSEIIRHVVMRIRIDRMRIRIHKIWYIRIQAEPEQS